MYYCIKKEIEIECRSRTSGFWKIMDRRLYRNLLKKRLHTGIYKMYTFYII